MNILAHAAAGVALRARARGHPQNPGRHAMKERVNRPWRSRRLHNADSEAVDIGHAASPSGPISMRFIRTPVVLMVTRLARSTRDLLSILDTIAEVGAGFKTAQGRLLLTFFGRTGASGNLLRLHIDHWLLRGADRGYAA
jgi:hypothetical protein